MANVLVVDDSRLARMIARKCLEEGGHTVYEAGSVQEAWTFISSQRPDVIVLDWNMPGGNGLELAELLHGDASGTSVPVVFATSEVDIVHQERAAEAGSRAYLIKPYSCEQINNAVAAATDSN